MTDARYATPSLVRDAGDERADDVARAALDLVRAGYAVLPLAPGDKRPLAALARHGYRSASCDPRTVARWWRAHPAANVGIRTGGAHVVVDVDARRGGPATLAALEAAHGSLPRDAAVDTPGGEHIYLSSALPLRTRALGPGVELLGAGKYAVAPPSRTYGLYRWRRGAPTAVDALPTAPPWLLALRPQREGGAPSRRARPTGPLRLPRWLPDYLARSQRRPTLVRLAGWLRGAGYDEADILAVLTGVRDERCAHPGEIPDVYLARLARYIGTRPAGTRRADLRLHLERVTATWMDRAAVRDRRVTLDAILPLVEQQGTSEGVYLAVRSVAVLARCARDTASRALRSLAHRGVIRVVRRAHHGDEHATEYRVSSADTSFGEGGEELGYRVRL